MNDKISLILPCFKRAKLLDLNLWSLTQQKIHQDLEIVVINDGIKDDTKNICEKYKDKLNIKYIFSGNRNLKGKTIWRCPGFAINIGVKQCQGNIIILSCPEILHLNNTIKLITEPLKENKKLMVTPRLIFFDDEGTVLNQFDKTYRKNCEECKQISFQARLFHTKNIFTNLESSQMPFFMAMDKNEFVSIGGYDEDFIGYAGDDNDLVGRLLLKGLSYRFVNATIVHLYHGHRCDSKCHFENPDWVYNYNLWKKKRKIIIRNKGRNWGKNL